MNIFQNKKTKIEILQEQYLKEFKAMTIYTNGVRVNEDLASRLKGYREIIVEESKCQPIVQSSTTRPVNYKNDIVAWLADVRLEALKLIKGKYSPLRKVA